MAKFIYITTKQGYTYKVPADVVAKDRANHYKDESPEAYQEEYDYTMSSDFELTDWFGNNMNWEDVAQYANLVSAPTPVVPDVGNDETEVVEEDDV